MQNYCRGIVFSFSLVVVVVVVVVLRTVESLDCHGTGVWPFNEQRQKS